MTTPQDGPLPCDIWGPLQTRTVEWRSECRPRRAMSMAGVDFLRAMLDKRLPAPPFAGLMQIDVTEIEPGRVTFTWVPDESMCNATGMIHGGIVCTLLETVTGCALLSTLPEGAGLASVEIKVNYLRPSIRAADR